MALHVSGAPTRYGAAQRPRASQHVADRYGAAPVSALPACLLVLLSALFLTTSALEAQTSDIEGVPPLEVQEEIFAFLNAP
jgi:hypothetical protein